jgi:hypothetical protein
MRSHLTRHAPALALAAALTLAGLATPPALAAQAGQSPAAPATPPSAADTKAMMDAYAQASQPGEHHKRLDTLIGKWTVTGKAWMGPGAASEVNGTMEASWLLGGRYVQEIHRSTFMGQPFEGRSIDGYDAASQEYFGTWIDTMGTGVEVFRGTCDSPCKVMTETAEAVDPVTHKKEKSREVITFVDPDTYRTEMYMVGAGPGGQDLKVMEMTARRVK